MALFPGTSPSGTLVDVSDRIARLLGRVSAVGSAIGSQSQGRQLNPGASAILADTGPLPAGTYRIRILSSGTVASEAVQIEHRNAANSINLEQFPAGCIIGVTQTEILVVLALNERVRVDVIGLPAGTYTWSLNWERLDA